MECHRVQENELNIKKPESPWTLIYVYVHSHHASYFAVKNRLSTFLGYQTAKFLSFIPYLPQTEKEID